MKKLFFLLFFANVCMAQGFIEIEVRDTLAMKPVGFVYQVGFDEYAQVEAYPADEDVMEITDPIAARSKKKLAEQKKVAELESFFKKKGYAFEENVSYDISRVRLFGGSEKSYLVRLKTVAELRKFIKEIQEMEGVTGSIERIDYGNTEKLESQLMDKLIKKAKTKAAMIAGMTNQKIGAIVEFRELKAADSMNFSFMDLVMNMKKYPRDFLKQNLDGEMMKAITVKFKTE